MEGCLANWNTFLCHPPSHLPHELFQLQQSPVSRASAEVSRIQASKAATLDASSIAEPRKRDNIRDSCNTKNTHVITMTPIPTTSSSSPSYPPHSSLPYTFTFPSTNVSQWLDYGCRGLEIRPAPASLRPAYEEDIHPVILHVLAEHDLITAGLAEIHVFRMGFDGPGALTILIIFAHNAIAPLQAEAILTSILTQLPLSATSLFCPREAVAEEVNCARPDPVQMDICHSRWTETLNLYSPQDVFPRCTHVYDTAPLPGSSISVDESKTTGTLFGYFQHDEEIYALTSAHVVHGPNRILDKQPYTFSGQADEQRYDIYLPSFADHTFVQGLLQEKIEFLQLGGDRYTVEVATVQKHLQQAQQYDQHLGSVKATSGLVKPPSENSRLDWALIQCRKDNTPEHRYINTGSLEQHALGRSPLLPMALTEKQKSNLEDWSTEPGLIRQINHCFSSSPSPAFGPISSNHFQAGGLYVKPPSARAHRFNLGGCNNIMSTLYHRDFGLTREWAFLPVLLAGGRCNKLSGRGDEGSSLLNSSFAIEGMIWGNNQLPSCVDVTFVTPIVAVLADVEERMGWARGSPQWLSFNGREHDSE
ncbi:hypothetical protein BP5796_12116 [Coleophoma crateriformis]|uniref:Uncharacterized protein n=1 Tax=Coleophoma crateriformis TaxID=565419 RepID=A0A3D8QBH0_9HELO|nr:hypothetical protein BP5796_12116 [Coleophoma crateriformis]